MLLLNSEVHMMDSNMNTFSQNSIKFWNIIIIINKWGTYIDKKKLMNHGCMIIVLITTVLLKYRWEAWQKIVNVAVNIFVAIFLVIILF